MSIRQKNKLNQKGFSPVELILIFVIATAVFGVGIFVWKSRPTALNIQSDAPKPAMQTPPQQQPANTSTPPQAGYKLLRFHVDTPAGWTSTTNDSTQGEGGPPVSTTTLKSPAGTELIISQDYGGYGGDCQPEPNDQPFKAGNKCPTYEVVYLEPTKGIAFDKTGKPIPILLTHIHFALPDGTAQYNICLQSSSSPESPVKANEPYMGFARSKGFITVYDSDGTLSGSDDRPQHPMYLTACATSTSPNFFTSQEGKTVQQILRSFKFTD